jgi:hypothetical protein
MRNRKNLKAYMPICVLLVAICCACASGTTIYVDAGALGPTHDGTSWGKAYKYLQDALNVATSGDEILVAQGTYKPDEDTANPTGTGDKTATFQLISGVAIYGGIGGGESILSGDIGTAGDSSDNSYHVVSSSWIDVTAVLDGFTITGGKTQGGGGLPEDYGGGMCNWHSSPTVTSCTFTKNSAEWGGGGMYNYNSSPAVSNCFFGENSAYAHGGGMRNDYYSSPIVTNCTFSGNWTSVGMMGAFGGGMCNFDSSPIVTNSKFSGNWASVGGGMYNHSSSPTLTNCTFSGNAAGSIPAGTVNVNNSESNDISPRSLNGQGGGMVNNINSNATLTNCTFSDNSAVYGGGMWNNSSSPTVTNCILWGNSDNGGSDESAQIDGGTPVVSYSCVQGLATFAGSDNIGNNPCFVDVDLRLSPGSPCINAGNNAALPPDTPDLDGDGDTTEPIPLDLDGNLRIFNDIVDMGAYESEGQGPSTITVEIDIKPGSYPSSINLQSKGVTPVAIHTTSIGDGESQDFDATTVNPITVLLNYLVAPLMWEIYDCDEFENPDYGLPGEPEMIGDGDDDLVLYFDTQELVATGAVEIGDEWAILTGETTGGTPVEGMGDVNIVVKGKDKKK